MRNIFKTNKIELYLYRIVHLGYLKQCKDFKSFKITQNYDEASEFDNNLMSQEQAERLYEYTTSDRYSYKYNFKYVDYYGYLLLVAAIASIILIIKGLI